MAQKAQRRAVLFILMLLSSLYPYSTQALAPVLVQMAEEFRITIGAAGLATAVYPVPSVAMAVLAGPYSDRHGRRRFLILGALILGLGSLAAMAAPTFEMVVAARAVAGIGGGLLASSMLATLADSFAPHERSRAMASLITASYVVGIVGLPLTGIVAAATSWRLPLGIVGVAGLAASLATAFLLPPSNAAPTTPNARALYGMLFRHPTALAYLAVGFLAALPTTGIWGAYTVAFFQTVFGLPQAVASALALTTGLGFILGGQLGSRLVDHAGHHRVLAASLGIGAIGLFAMTNLPAGVFVATGLSLVVSISSGARMVTYTPLVSDLLPQARATVLSVFSGLNAAAVAIGVTVAGQFIDIAGFSPLGVFCSSLLIMTTLMFWSVARRPTAAPA